MSITVKSVALMFAPVLKVDVFPITRDSKARLNNPITSSSLGATIEV